MTNLKIILIAIGIGIINAVVFVVFEWLVNTGTNYIWNDIFNTDTIRWLVIPVGIVLSIAFSALLKFLKQDRIIPVKLNLEDELKIEPTSLTAIGMIFVVGLSSLLAGASLGPEASLLGVSLGIGIWIGQKRGDIKKAGIYALSSVGALFVSFFGSLIPIAMPILFLLKKEEKLVPAHMVPPVIAGVTAYFMLIALKGKPDGYGSFSISPDFQLIDLFTALLLGIVGAFIAYGLKGLIKRFAALTKRIESRTHWIVSAVIFGGILGTLYFIGGQPIEFSGSEGTKLLTETIGTYTTLSLIILLIAKFLATSWSLPIGYRGGLVFPSILLGDAMGQLVKSLDSNFTGPGIVLGSISGILTAMTSPVLGFIIILSISPIQLLGVAIAGLIGAMIGKKIIYKVSFQKKIH